MGIQVRLEGIDFSDMRIIVTYMDVDTMCTYWLWKLSCILDDENVISENNMR